MKLLNVIVIAGLLSAAYAATCTSSSGCSARQLRAQSANSRTNSCGVVSSDCGPFGDGSCAQQPFAIFHNGLWWAYASPCAGDCSQICNPIPYGWRAATNLEFANHPAAGDFIPGCVNPGVVHPGCAATIFDPSHDHCDCNDYNAGRVTNNPFLANGLFELVLVHDLEIQAILCPADGCHSDADCPGDNYCMIESHEFAPINVCHGCPETDPCCEHPSGGGDCSVAGGCNHDSDCPAESYCKTWDAVPHVCQGCDHTDPCCLEGPLNPECPADGCHTDDDCPGDNYCMIEGHENDPIKVCHGCIEADPCCDPSESGGNGDCSVEGGCNDDADCPTGSYCKTWQLGPHVCQGCDASDPCCREGPLNPECPEDGCHSDDDCPGDNYCMIESHENAPINVCHGCTEADPCCDPSESGGQGDCSAAGGCDQDSDCPSESYCKTWDAGPHVCHGCEASNPCCLF